MDRDSSAFESDQTLNVIAHLLRRPPTGDAELPREDKLSALADSLPQMVFTCDAYGKKTFCCRRYLRYTGCSSMEEMDRIWLDLIHSGDRASVASAWRHALETGTEYVAAYRMRRYDGVYRHQLARALPVRNASGVITDWVGTITDIEQEKKNDELLRVKEKLAAAGLMAATMAHEINNPLAAVTNTLYLALQDKALSTSTREFLKLADLELSRVALATSHSLRFHSQNNAAMPVRLSNVLESLIGYYMASIQANSIYVECDYRTKDKLYCRADDIHQMLSHLLRNAIEAMPHGGRLRVRVRRGHRWSASEPAGINVIIADNGTGIPAHILPRVFEAFTSTKKHAGIGLGLWVVDDIVRRHDGHISLRSCTGARNHGTVISVFLPFLRNGQVSGSSVEQ